MRPTVLVVGDVCRRGEFHMGDEAMFEVAVALLRDQYECTPVGIVEDVEIALARYGINAAASISFSNSPLESQLASLESLVNDPDSASELHGAMQGASLLLIAGGGNLASGFGYLILERLFLVRLAQRYGVPVALMSQSIGPFSNSHEREAVGEIVRTAQIVGVREFESWQECLSLGVRNQSLRLSGDDALELCSARSHSTTMSRIALSIDTHLWHGDPTSAHVMVTEALSYARDHGLSVLVLPQTWSEDGESHGTDQWVAEQIHARGSEEFPSVVVETLEDLRPHSVAEAVATCRTIVSSRYHPVVFGTAHGVPAVFVSANSYTRRKGEGTQLLSATPGATLDIPLAPGDVSTAIDAALTSTRGAGGRNASRLESLAASRHRTYRDLALLARGEAEIASPRVAICTIVAENYLAQAAVLEDSVRRLHPEASMVTMVVDDESSSRGDQRITVSQIGLSQERIHQMAATYSVTEFATAVKPSLLKYLLSQGFDQVWYLDPDICLYAPLLPVQDALRTHAVALTPHTLEAFPVDGMTPSESDVRLSGVYNLGFIAVTADAHTFLDWWENQLRTNAIVDVASGLFTDQKWVDFAPALCDTHILDNPGLNVAYWNLQERQIDRAADGSYTSNREPLFFYHFSGFDPRRPYLLSRHMGNNPRVSVFSQVELGNLVQSYGEQLLRNDFVRRTQSPYGWSKASNGLVIDAMVRRAYRASIMSLSPGSVPSPFDAQRTPDFENWLEDNLGEHWRLVPPGVRNLWFTNSDLRSRFPEPCGRDAFDVLTWASKNRWVSELEQEQCRSGLRQLTPRSRELLPVGFNLVGYVTAGMGLGEASRRIASTLTGTGLPVRVIKEEIHHGTASTEFRHSTHAGLRYTNSVVAVNASAAAGVCSRLGISKNPLGRTVGLWFWELEDFHSDAAAFAPFDEIWTASEFMTSAIRRGSPIPVRTMKLEIPTVAADQLPSRHDVGFDERFTYFFTYDANSVFRRKNPLGLIAAYRHAFYSPRDARLVIRVLNAWRHPEDFASLLAASHDRPDIDIVAAARSATVAQAEIARADCFVSLHRSEGFGLNIATAASAGTPIIATDYSGSREFLDPAGTWLVPCRRVRIGDGADPYPSDDWWAEPDHDHAVAQIRAVFEDTNRTNRAQVAREFVRTHYSHEQAVSRMKELLEIGSLNDR